MALPSLKDLKNWNTEIEKQITESWKKSEAFGFEKTKAKKIYSIDTPPPYVNAPIHIGHAITYCYMDFFARYKRMKGHSVIFPLGLDRNGLPIEMAAERKFGVDPVKVGRERFIQLCERLLAETSEESTDSFARLGISFTSYKKGNHIGSVYLTDSPSYRALTQTTFIELFKKGLVYEDLRINNWDPKLQTTIADSEIEYRAIGSVFNDVRWKVKETGEEIIISTTRPELICTCGMVIYHPDDKRYRHLEGKTAISPVFEKEVPIKGHKMADPDKGSGVVMMCSAGDLSDIQFFREMGLKPLIAIEKDGTMNEHAGPLKGLKVRDARKRMIEHLKDQSHIAKQENIQHRTPISERSGAEIEFIEMPEYYLKQLEFKSDLKKISKEIDFYPKRARKILDDWIESVSIDWPISRRRYYATPIPLWKSGDLVALPPAGKYYQPWREKPPKDSEVYKNGKSTGNKVSDLDTEWEPETRVFDTWMDSSISELFMLQYKEDDSFFKRAFPATLRPQGKEIVRTWLYYTILRGFLETGKACFRQAWIHQHILDDKGRKMSKSLGNVIDPQELLKDYGAEPTRLWAATEGNLARQDLRCSKEKIQAETKTLNKILNISRFVSLFKKPDKPKLTATDKHFIEYADFLARFADEHYEAYDFFSPATRLRQVLWDTFASHYLELVKARAYNQDKTFSKEESESAHHTLHYILERILTLLHPIIPQITSVILKSFGSDFGSFPEGKKVDKKSVNLIEKSLVSFNSKVWKAKKEKGISLKSSVSGIKIPSPLKDFEKDLKACHKLE